MAQSKKNHAGIVSGSAIATFVGAALIGVAHAGTLTVGPVEQVNLKASTLVVLGQTYHVDASTLITNRAGRAVTLGSLVPNALVSIAGTETLAGRATVASVRSLPQLDIPGATPLLVTGVVSTETPTGEIKVGNLTVDIVATLTGGAAKFHVGNLVEITGTQPNPNGIFLARTIAVSAGLQGGGAAAMTKQGLQGGGAAATTNLGLQGGGAAAMTKQGLQGGGAAATTNLGLQGGGAAATTNLGLQGGGAAATTNLGLQGGGAAATTNLGLQGGGAAATTNFGLQGGGAAATTNLGLQGGGAAATTNLGLQGGGK